MKEDLYRNGRESFLPKGAGIILDKLQLAGFDPATIEKVEGHIKSLNITYNLNRVAEKPIGLFKFINTSVDKSAVADFVSNLIIYPNTNPSVENELDLCFGVWNASKNDQKIADAMRSVIKPNLRLDPNTSEIKSTRIALQVLRNPIVFNLFNNNVQDLNEYLNQIRNDKIEAKYLDVGLSQIYFGKFKKELLSGLDVNFLSHFDSLYSHTGLNTILNDRKLAIFANEIIRNNSKVWVDRLLDFVVIIKTLGFDVVKTKDVDEFYLNEYANYANQIKNLNKKGVIDLLNKHPKEKFIRVAVGLKNLKDAETLTLDRHLIAKKLPEYEVESQENLARIKRRENPMHPLNTLGIAKTVGYEVEFPIDEITNVMGDRGLFEILSFAGIKQGAGAIGSYETSPGPFWDPLTATTLFNAYCDAGIINLDKYNRFTFHFNVGINDDLSLTPLIRALYLTGAGYDPNVEFSEGWLRIFSNNQGMGAYTECKSFSAITQKDFVWNLKSASYLSWALDAHQNLKSMLMTNKWHVELAEIWKKYRSTIYSGLANFQIYTNLDESQHLRSSQIIAGELSKIFVNKASWYDDLSKIGLDDPKITKIRVGGETYPNLAYFARVATDHAVQSIEALADNFENEIREEIIFIEKSRAYFKNNLKFDFENRYKVKSFEDTKKLFFGA